MMLSGFKKYRITALLLAAICLLTLSQCKRSEEPFNNNIGTPVFALKGTVDGQPFNKIAGIDSYYMYTSYAYDSAQELFSFSGKLARINCTTCEESIEIIMYDKVKRNSAIPVDILSALPEGIHEFYSFRPIFQKRYRINFQAQGLWYSLPRYRWTFGSDTSSSPNPVVYFYDTIAKNVCLTITDDLTTCTKTICNSVGIPQNQAYFYVKPDFSYDTLGGNNIRFNDLSSRPSGTTYSWDFGDGNNSIDSLPTHLYSSPGRYIVTLTISGGFGVKTITKYVDVQVTNPDCLTNFSYSSPVLDSTISPSLPLATVIIRYVDANGEVYLSSGQDQPITSRFNVATNQLYQNNEKEEKTAALNITFTCRVFSTTTTKFKDIVITNGTIAVAYK